MLAQKSTVCNTFMGMKLDFQLFPAPVVLHQGTGAVHEDLPENGDIGALRGGESSPDDW